MSTQGDALRAQATILETAAMSPWTSNLPEVAKATAAVMRQQAAKNDQAVALNLPTLAGILS